MRSFSKGNPAWGDGNAQLKNVSGSGRTECGGEGHFMALLKKDGTLPEEFRIVKMGEAASLSGEWKKQTPAFGDLLPESECRAIYSRD